MHWCLLGCSAFSTTSKPHCTGIHQCQEIASIDFAGATEKLRQTENLFPPHKPTLHTLDKYIVVALYCYGVTSHPQLHLLAATTLHRFSLSNSVVSTRDSVGLNYASWTTLNRNDFWCQYWSIWSNHNHALALWIQTTCKIDRKDKRRGTGWWPILLYSWLASTCLNYFCCASEMQADNSFPLDYPFLCQTKRGVKPLSAVIQYCQVSRYQGSRADT